MKALIPALILFTITGCKREDFFTARGPGGFMREEFQIELGSIPHQTVRHFNGVVLVLELDKSDVVDLKADRRFHWGKPQYKGHYTLGSELFMDGDRFEIMACQWEDPRSATGFNWKMIAVDSTRGRLFAAVDAWPLFKGFLTPKPNKQIGQDAGGKGGPV